VTVLGVLYPGYSSEIDYVVGGRLLRPEVDVSVVHTDVDDDSNSIEAARQTGDPERLLKGVRALRGQTKSSGLDAVLWASTSGGFVFGFDGAQAQVDQLADAAGVPATSTSLAFVAAAHAMGITRVAVGATYPGDEAALFGVFLQDAGIEVLACDAAGIAQRNGGAWLSEDAVISLVVGADRDGAEAILLPDAAIATMARLDKLEAAAGKPVLTANQVTIWDGLRLAGVLSPQANLGALFRLPVAAAGI